LSLRFRLNLNLSLNLKNRPQGRFLLGFGRIFRKNAEVFSKDKRGLKKEAIVLF
jgi:hypothetical protein